MTDAEFETVLKGAHIASGRGYKNMEAHRGTALGEDYQREYAAHEKALVILRTEEARRSQTTWRRFVNWLGVGE